MTERKAKWLTTLLINLEAKAEGKKYCGKCKKLLSMSCFHRDKSTGTGLRHHCKACQSKIYQAYVDKFKTKHPAGD